MLWVFLGATVLNAVSFIASFRTWAKYHDQLVVLKAAVGIIQLENLLGEVDE